MRQKSVVVGLVLPVAFLASLRVREGLKNFILRIGRQLWALSNKKEKPNAPDDRVKAAFIQVLTGDWASAARANDGAELATLQDAWY